MATKEQQKGWDAATKANRKKKGICRSCCNKISPRSTVLCDDCLRKNRERLKKYKRKTTKWSKLVNQANRRGIEVEMSRLEFVKWLNEQEKQCAYCSVTESVLKKSVHDKRALTIDRRENALPYKISNICLCCSRCNIMKSNFFSASEWSEIAVKYIKPRIDEYHPKKSYIPK